MRVITLEEHFATPLFLDGPGQDLKKAALKFEGRAMKLIEPLCDIGDKRLAAMDAAGIDFQMLSLTSPGTEQLEPAEAIALARDANDAVAESVKKNPKRFGGFAALPLFPRLDNMTPAMTKLQRPITAYLRENVYYTVSGFNFPTTFLNLLLEVGVPRIMFSADHPYQSMPLACAFLDQLPVSAADRERIAHGNAEKLFGV